MKVSSIAIALVLLAGITTSFSCSKDPLLSKYKTQNIIIVVVDGARYTETWGEPQKQYIPMRSTYLAPLGTVCTSMYNEGGTSTISGHTALTRGEYEFLNNTGLEYPAEPSLLQYWLKYTGKPAEKAWIVTTKDKLEVLANCTDPGWKDKYLPRTDCGVAGLGTGYRNDSTTLEHAKNILATYHPNIMVINFKEPDASGHSANWNNYLHGIRSTDAYCVQLWNYLQSDSIYRNSTTLFISNDHGRHTIGHLDGFVSHGDTCEGCKHIEFIAVGPDIKANNTDNKKHSQVDIAVTAAALMGIQMDHSKGRIMTQILK
jgi:hypothetical protein